MSTQGSHGIAPVVVEGLTRRFKRKTALDNVDLTVPRGKVFGLVGENGAGKTTLIKHVMGLLQAREGRVRVFGDDPVTHPKQVLSRIGYLSENRDLPDWMRVSEVMRFVRPFYPDWDDTYAEELRDKFALDPKSKVKTLSRGERAKMGLLVALAHRPDLLVLDEPSSGLDPVIRRDILGAIVRTVADEGRTVLFSSHLLDEVERVADVVTMIHSGRVVIEAPLETIRAEHVLMTLRFAESQTSPPDLPGALSWEGAGEEWTAVCNGQRDALRATAAQLGAEIVDERTPTLEDIFIARVRAGATSGREG